MGDFVGIPTGFSVGMGWVWGFKLNPHGSPESDVMLAQRAISYTPCPYLAQVGVLSKWLYGSSWCLARRLPPSVLHCVVRKRGYLQNNGTLSQFRHGTSIVANCCQFGWTKVDERCDRKLAAVVGRTKMTIPATLDVQFITLFLRLCLQLESTGLIAAGTMCGAGSMELSSVRPFVRPIRSAANASSVTLSADVGSL